MITRSPGRHALAFIALTLLLDTVGFGLIVPVMPTLLMQLTGRGVSRVAIYGGWLGFVYATLQFLCSPVLGNLSDRFGRRPVLLLAIGALGIDYAIMGFSPTLTWLFLGRAISGIAGASFTPAYAYVADISAPEQRARNFGVISAMFGLGFIAGPALGGLLGGFGPRAPFFAAAALSLLNLAYGAVVLPESLPAERRRPFHWHRADPAGTLRQMRANPAVFGSSSRSSSGCSPTRSCRPCGASTPSIALAGRRRSLGPRSPRWVPSWYSRKPPRRACSCHESVSAAPR